MLTLWPPGPLEQNVSMRRSFALICTSTSSASGSTATVTVEVWMRPGRFGCGHALHAMHAALVLQLAVRPAPLDGRDDFLDAADIALARRHQLDAPALLFGELAVHAEELVGEQRRFLAARARANFEHDVLLIVRDPSGSAGS